MINKKLCQVPPHCSIGAVLISSDSTIIKLKRMLIYIGADHRGFNLKERAKDYLKNQGYEVVDVGAETLKPEDDYTYYARLVAEKVSAESEASRGILICGSGVGVDIVANKFADVRSGLAISTDQIFAARHDDNINVLSIASDFTEENDAQNFVRIFLATPFGAEERYKRRLGQISEIENSRQ